jgi:hypothetical protein
MRNVRPLWYATYIGWVSFWRCIWDRTNRSRECKWEGEWGIACGALVGIHRTPACRFVCCWDYKCHICQCQYQRSGIRNGSKSHPPRALVSPPSVDPKFPHKEGAPHACTSPSYYPPYAHIAQEDLLRPHTHHTLTIYPSPKSKHFPKEPTINAIQIE